MSTTMVGEETELELTPDNTDGGHKETKKARLIDAFFQPVKAKEDAKTSLESGIEISSANSSQSMTNIHVNRTGSEVIHDPKTIGSINKKDGHTLKRKKSNFPGKLGYQTPEQDSSQGEEVKPKKLKPKWSVTCAVRNTSKLLNSSGSDFEDDGRDSFNTKSKLVQKSRKKKARHQSRTVHESKRNTSESADDKGKNIKITQAQKSNRTESVLGQQTEESKCESDIDSEAKALDKCEQSKQLRTSAFDVLMNSQRVQKLEGQRTDVSLEESQNTSTVMSETSNSCEVVDDKEMVQSKSNVIKSHVSMEDSPSDVINTNKSCETNAFDLLMKKGKSPSGADSQLQSEQDKLSENVDSSPKKKPKKKTFEFHLSIRASGKKDVEFLEESDNPSTDAVTCEKNVKGKRKKKRSENGRDGRELVEGEGHEVIVTETFEEVVEVSKSKRGRKTTKVANEINTEADKIVTEERKKNEKKKRKSGKRSTSGTEKVNVVSNDASGSDISEPQCVKVAQSKSKNTKQQGKDDGGALEIKERKISKTRKRMKSDAVSSSTQLLSTECQETSVCYSDNTEDVEQTKKKRGEKKKNDRSSKEQSSTDKKYNGDKKDKVDNEKEMGTKDVCHNETTTACNEPKPLASIFIKKKPVPLKADTTEEPSTTAAHQVSSTTTTSTACSVIAIDNTTNECSTSNVDSLTHKEKPTIDQEAAKKAFNALFTGARYQKTLPAATIAESLPAPWPLVSHVCQEEEDVSLGVNFWSLPWPTGKSHKSDIFLCSSLPHADIVASTLSQEEKVMFCGQRVFEQSLCRSKKSEHKATPNSFSEAVTKNILSELALSYPGVPLRKLYKRYSSKLQKHSASSIAVDIKQAVPESMPGENFKHSQDALENKNEEHDVMGNSSVTKKGRGKRRLSSDGDISQEKKVARKNDAFSASVSTEGQGPTTDQHTNKSRKKRGREEDGDQGQEKVAKGQRLSTRLQKKKTTLESEIIEDKLEQTECTSNRKKRRRTSDHRNGTKGTSEPSIQLNKAAETPVVSNSDKSNVESFVNDTLWTDLYRPLLSTEVMANVSSVSKLRSWLEQWKIKREKTLRKELQQQKRLLAKQKGKPAQSSQSSSHTLEWWDEDSDSDFQMSDNASDDSDTEECGLNTAMFISGPTGVGKTAMVYACAEELGYKVFEVNSSSRRSGRQIMSQLEEATQSHLVINNKGPAPPTPQSSFSGLFNKPVNSSPPPSGPLGAFLQQNTNVSETKAKKNEKGKKERSTKEKKIEGSKGKGKSILKQPSQPVKDDTESCSSLSSKAASLILFEEVDIIFEQDKSFWMAVNSFMQNAKCPIVLISTDSQVSCEGRYEQINLKPPSVNLLAAHLQLIALTNNMFVNPEDLKCLVAQNNCDIRKSLFDLQFWSASGGGAKMPYKRPEGLNNKADVADKDPKPRHISVSYDSSTEHRKAGSSSQDALQIKPPVLGGILNDDGEESMFLSLSDWQAIKSRGSRCSSRVSQRGIPRQADGDNSDSDFCELKKARLVCPDGSTDSVFEITDTNDSQPVSSNDKKADDTLQLPPIDSLLFDSVHGLLNCVANPSVGSLSILQKEKKSRDEVEDRNITDKLRLTHFSQGLDVNLIHTNLSNLIPLFADPSTSLSQTKRDPPGIEDKATDIAAPNTEKIMFKSDNIFSDKRLFDDGTDETINKGETDIAMETNQSTEKESEDVQTKAEHSSQDSTDTGFSESQPKEDTGADGQGQGHEEDSVSSRQSDEKGKQPDCKKPSNEERCCTKALEVFAQFAENLSFSDVFCPSLSVPNTQSSSVEFGWWKAPLKPGLTDEYVTVQEYSDWLARDTRAYIRGALEVANLENCRVKVNSLAEDLKEIENLAPEEATSTSENKLCNFKLLSEDLPLHDSSTVLRLDAITQTQKSSTASRRKLHNSLALCIPTLYHCDHRCVAGDYIPTFRLLCHSERLREAANIKRRFLHYLDLNSFPLSRSTMEALADSYLAQ